MRRATVQLAARGLCQRGCGRAAAVEVTWAAGTAELLCDRCWAAQAAADAAAGMWD
jgi:hypothetical protein